MSNNTKSPFTAIDPAQLEKVAGGASRNSSRSSGSSDQLTLLLTQVTDSIKDLANNQNQGSDPMQMMLMMMMMGGMGGGGGGAAPAPAAAAAPPTPVISVTTDVKRGC